MPDLEVIGGRKLYQLLLKDVQKAPPGALAFSNIYLAKDAQPMSVRDLESATQGLDNPDVLERLRTMLERDQRDNLPGTKKKVRVLSTMQDWSQRYLASC